jgi:Trypsin-co-occurring domain 1
VDEGAILVQVTTDAEDRRQIRWNLNVAEHLESRIDDIKASISMAASAIADSLPERFDSAGWEAKEVSATFGISLTAGAGAIISKAEAGATFEVSISFVRE